MKSHISDIRFRNNAGIKFPVCCSQADYLDFSKCNWEFETKEKATCKNCQKIFAKRYPWAAKS